MKIQTFSIVIGTSACDAACPFCISHTTGFENLPKGYEVNYRNLRKAIRLAQMGGSTTVLLTGKGEPTLYPDEIKFYLHQLKDQFPFVELQTNAIQMGHIAHAQTGDFALPSYVRFNQNELKEWHELGLNTIAISTVGVNHKHNEQIYRKPYPDLARTIEHLHWLGFSVRLCVMMVNNMVDSPGRVREVIRWCKKMQVEQLTIRPIRRPDPKRLVVLQRTSEDKYIASHGLTEAQEKTIREAIEQDGSHIMTLMNGGHQARVYDYEGQNVCVSDCLTVEPSSDEIRTLIYYGSGKLFYDWQYQGARLL
jgi:molybdenum cofactor biosynthesis enzyme MoaA